MRPLLVLLGSAALVGSMAAAPGQASGHAAARAAARPAAAATADRAGADDLGHYDSRRAASPRAGHGIRGLLELDPATGTVRILEKLDGFLTGPSGRPARSVPLSYVRSHVRALGLTRTDLRTFHF